MTLPRYAPEIPLPPYTYVPGRAPHPVTDPRGHMFGAAEQHVEPPDPSEWRNCEAYRFGIDLFNHGYYWEAHEAWERVWIAAGRSGVAADFLKGLIKLAAAGVKFREGNPAGARRHLDRARELFEQTVRPLDDSCRSYFGLDVRQLIDWSAAPLPGEESHGTEGVPVVFNFVLEPET